MNSEVLREQDREQASRKTSGFKRHNLALASFKSGVCCFTRAWSLVLGVSAVAAEFSAEQVAFFESRIRPLFVDHCYSCHSETAEKLKGGLRLDTREAARKGGNTGVVIVPGDPKASLLIKAVRYNDPELQMPPKDKKLTDAQIADLESWITLGAPDPRNAPGSKPLTDIAEARARHWAFQPVTKPPPPAIRKPRRALTPVDNFILAKLDEKKLKPAKPADRRTLIRRVAYDLTGLPPTPDDVEKFAKDNKPGDYARLVDRLLASPHYGERWGRYWLDVARYADTKGYLAGGEERRYPFSYTYRDYVVRAFNEDKPYDQFLIEQIAGDRLAQGEDRSTLAALGFLTLGRRFLNNQNDIIDDRIDVITRGTLGLTVSCARCHDHKFDPIPTKDYYALHGVFASSEEPVERPLLGTFHDSPEYQDYLKQKAKIEKEIERFKDEEIAKFIAGFRLNIGDYLLGARDAKRLAEPTKFDTFAGERMLNPTILRRWMSDLESRRQKPDPIFGPWFALSELPEPEFSTSAGRLLETFSADSTLANSAVAVALAAGTTNALKQAAAAYNTLFKAIDAEWTAVLAAAKKDEKPPPIQLPDGNREALRQVLYAEGTPINLLRAEAEVLHARRLGEGAAPLRNKIEALSWTHPGVPLRAMALSDNSKPHNSRVFLRGNEGNPGAESPRRFLEVLSGEDRAPFTNGSGRLELARAIASRDNPLTARVYVNRVWLHHFGRGLVGTPGDFGVRTEAPLHRELLDYLAASFSESGWSTKELHRRILLSSTYQQGSEVSPASRETDPDNRYFSRMDRQRLDLEAMRDTLLAVSGKLDPSMGGVPVDIVSAPFSSRRSLYGLVDRQNLPGLFRTFDFANPDTSNQGRFQTTVPQQALFLMNSPFVIEQARHIVQRPEVKSADSLAEKIQALHRLVWQRPAETGDVRLGEAFIVSQSQTNAPLAPLEKYAQVLLLSNELMFVD